jgi:hypothetical protein
MHDPRELQMTALKHILHYLQGTLDLVCFFVSHPHSSLLSTLMLIGQDAPTLASPLMGMQSSLVTISSPGPPRVRTRSLAPAQKHNTELLPMAL